jgi:cytochrome c-type protein NapB
MTRNGDMLGQVSTRRYFCMQCHVSQDAVRPIVNNNFQDVDAVILKSLQSSKGAAPKR